MPVAIDQKAIQQTNDFKTELYKQISVRTVLSSPSWIVKSQDYNRISFKFLTVRN